MFYSRLLSYGCLFAIAANAQTTSSSSSSSESSSSSGGQTVLSGTSELATPTGEYLSISTTITRSSAVTTSAILSTVTSGSTTRTTTLGSTTIFAMATIVGNGTNGTSTSTSTSSQTFLVGGSHTTSSINGTSNSTATSSSSAAQPTNTTPCNNYVAFCGRKYGNVTEVAAHNSPFVKPGNAAANQALDVTIQLNDGVRLLQGQMHFVNDTTGTGRTPHFCHTSCDVLDAGPITEYLGQVYNWVKANPYDIVTILLGNGGYDPVESYVPFIEQTGLVQYAYEPPIIPMGIDDWPTYASMILSGKRVVFFMDYDANQTSTPWILDEFSQMWETPFDPTDRSFPCTAQRPPNLSDADAKKRLYLMNHNLNYDINLLGNSLLVPNIPLLPITNNVTGNGSLGISTGNCLNQWDYPPKFLNVDYYNIGSPNGSVFEVQAIYNNVTYTRACCGATSTSGAERTREVVGRSAMLMALLVVAFSWALL